MIFTRRLRKEQAKQTVLETLDHVERTRYPILAVPFHGTAIPVMVRELTEAQILSCGDFSLIETFEDKIAKENVKYSMKEIIAYADRHHEIARAALVKPTYEQLIAVVSKDAEVEKKREELKELKEKLKSTPLGKIRAELEERIDLIRIWVDLILPEDFLSFVVGYALKIDKSDIKKVSEEMLVNAAVLAERGHDNPADHIGGEFTDFMRDDINARAWILLSERKKERDGR